MPQCYQCSPTLWYCTYYLQSVANFGHQWAGTTVKSRGAKVLL